MNKVIECQYYYFVIATLQNPVNNLIIRIYSEGKNSFIYFQTNKSDRY